LTVSPLVISAASLLRVFFSLTRNSADAVFVPTTRALSTNFPLPSRPQAIFRFFLAPVSSRRCFSCFLLTLWLRFFPPHPSARSYSGVFLSPRSGETADTWRRSSTIWSIFVPGSFPRLGTLFPAFPLPAIIDSFFSVPAAGLLQTLWTLLEFPLVLTHSHREGAEESPFPGV